MTFLSLALALLQAIDIVLHVATDQAELLRIAANLIMLAWIGLAASGRFSGSPRLLAVTALVAYLGLNLTFLAQAGVTNPAQGGALRVALFVLVVLTAALASGLIYARGQTKV